MSYAWLAKEWDFGSGRLLRNITLQQSGEEVQNFST